MIDRQRKEGLYIFIVFLCLLIAACLLVGDGQNSSPNPGSDGTECTTIALKEWWEKLTRSLPASDLQLDLLVLGDGYLATGASSYQFRAITGETEVHGRICAANGLGPWNYLKAWSIYGKQTGAKAVAVQVSTQSILQYAQKIGNTKVAIEEFASLLKAGRDIVYLSGEPLFCDFLKTYCQNLSELILELKQGHRKVLLLYIPAVDELRKLPEAKHPGSNRQGGRNLMSEILEAYTKLLDVDYIDVSTNFEEMNISDVYVDQPNGRLSSAGRSIVENSLFLWSNSSEWTSPSRLTSHVTDYLELIHSKSKGPHDIESYLRHKIFGDASEQGRTLLHARKIRE